MTLWQALVKDKVALNERGLVCDQPNIVCTLVK